MKALIIEDDPAIVESVSLAFRMRWPNVSLLTTHLGKQGLDLVGSEEPDIIILDLGLPDISGFEVLKGIRLFSSVPVIILTVREDEADIVKGLEWGADDYIVKPCGQLELMARIKARVGDKSHYLEEMPLTVGPLRFDPPTRQLICGEREINLTAIEAQIISSLMKEAGRVATYARLAEAVWGDDYPGSVDSLRVHIRRLRAKIETDPGHPQLILTKSGIGYFLAKPDRI